MRLAIDIDDVLFPWTFHAHNACEAAGITNGKTITRWGFHEDYGCTQEQLWEVINREYRHGMLMRAPYPGVVAALADLRDAGHTIHLVTARGFEGKLAPMIRRDTQSWIAGFGVPHDTLTFARDKRVIAADAFLDDGPHNLDAVMGFGVYTFLRDQPHNRHDDNHERVRDLSVFAERIQSITTASI